MATIAETSGTDRMQELFITGLKNAHAMEKQALSIMTPQMERIEHYPEVAERLREHIAETNDQLMRIDEIFDALGSRASALKDTGWASPANSRQSDTASPVTRSSRTASPTTLSSISKWRATHR
jgi:hypothetical protein